MEPDKIEPVIIESSGTPDPLASPFQFVLYDDMFSEEYLVKYELESPEIGALRRPHFTTAEVATWVFGKNLDWMKNQFRKGPLHVDGKELQLRRLKYGRRSNKGTGERRLTLPDCERLAWALYQRGDITGYQLQSAMEIIVAVARQHGRPQEEKTN